MNVYAQDKFGMNHQLALHTEKNIDSRTNLFLNYQDRILKGEIVYDRVVKALKEDFGITKIYDFELIEEPVEEEDDDTDETFRYMANIEVPFDESSAGPIGEIFASWIEIK